MISLIPTEFDLAHAKRLFVAAAKVRLRAYAPYSNFLVGAAILTASGRIYAGCNVEAADYDGTHAEEAALAIMVANDERSPVLLAVFGGLDGIAKPTIVPPCGKCRQKLKEFASLSGRDLRVLIHDESGELRLVPLSELLPLSFGPRDIGVDLAKHRR